MTRITAATPADVATTIQLPRVYNLAYPELADSLDVTATKSGGGACGATSWEVLDDDGNQVATGAWSGTTVTIGVAGVGSFARYNWLTFHLIGPDHGDGAWGTDYGTMRFAIAERFAGIPDAPLRSSNPSNVSSGLDAPLAHGVFSLGGARIGVNAQDIQVNRQHNGTTALAATSAAITLATFTSTTDSMLTMVWAIIGDDTGAVGPSGWTLEGSQSQGAGATKVTVKIYRLYGSFAGGTSWSVSTTNAADQYLYLTEDGPYIKNQAALAVQFVTGNGASVAISKDFTSLATDEYAVLSGVVANGAVTYQSQVSTPALSTVFGQGRILAGTQDAFGAGANNTITYTLSGAADYVGFIIGYLHDTGSPLEYSAAGARSAIDAWWNAWGQYEDPARPYRQVTLATTLANANAVTSYSARIAQIVADTNRYRLRGDGSSFIGCFTGRNEPNGSYSIAENNSFAASVRAGDATAVPGGPGYVSLNYAFQADYFAKIDAGMFGASGMGANTFHDYNIPSGGPADCISILRDVKAGLTSRGITKPIFMTEGGHDTTWWPGIFRLRSSGSAYMLNTVAREILLGMPYEHQSWYYDRRGGFDSVTTWQLTDLGPYLGIVQHRAFAREVYGKTIEYALSFGTYDDFTVAGVWKNATDGSRVMALIGAHGTPAVTFYVSGDPAPATLVTVDRYGNRGTVTVTNRTFTLTPDDRIQYVRLPAGLKVAARPIAQGINLIPTRDLTVSDSGDGSALQADIKRLVDGSLLSPYSNNTSSPAGGHLYWLNTTTFPRNITFAFAFGETATGDTLSLYCPVPWQAMGAILKGKLQYTTDGTTWTDAGSWDNTATVTKKNYDLGGDTLADAYTTPPHYFEFDLGGQITVKGARIVVTTGSKGMYLDAMMFQPTGTANDGSSSGGAALTAHMAELRLLNKAANVPHPAMAG